MKEWFSSFLAVSISLILAVLSTWGVYSLSGRPFEVHVATILCMSWLAGYVVLLAVLSSYDKDMDKLEFAEVIVLAMILPLSCSAVLFC